MKKKTVFLRIFVSSTGFYIPNSNQTIHASIIQEFLSNYLPKKNVHKRKAVLLCPMIN